MFCNTYILFFEIFMWKVLRLRFSYYKVRTFFFYIFWFRSKTWNWLGFSAIGTPFVHLIWFGRTKNGWRLGRNGNVNLALALSHIVSNGCWLNIWRKCMALWQNRLNLGNLQLLKEVFDIKTMLKWTLTSWDMSWPCKGRMIKKLLIALVPKPNTSGIS